MDAIILSLCGFTTAIPNEPILTHVLKRSCLNPMGILRIEYGSYIHCKYRAPDFVLKSGARFRNTANQNCVSYKIRSSLCFPKLAFDNFIITLRALTLPAAIWTLGWTLRLLGVQLLAESVKCVLEIFRLLANR
jgi:hypothetical protein